MKTNKAVDFMKRFILTMLFPLVVYIVMYILAKSKGVTYYGITVDMWRTVLVNTSSTAVTALSNLVTG